MRLEIHDDILVHLAPAWRLGLQWSRSVSFTAEGR